MPTGGYAAQRRGRPEQCIVRQRQSGRLDVVIQVEDIVWVVLPLHSGESRVVLPSEASHDAILALVPDEVEVDGAAFSTFMSEGYRLLLREEGLRLLQLGALGIGLLAKRN